MLRGKLKRLLAFALSVILASQLVTLTVPRAAAVDVEPALFAASGGGKQFEFNSPDNGRPNLYVDFLGDNWHYQPGNNGTVGDPSGNNDTAPQAGLVAPAAYDQSNVTNPAKDADTNPTGTNNTWEGYKSDTAATGGKNYKGSVFWVGVGVDRTEVLKLLEDAANTGFTGLTSLELGFYYNERFLKPYVAAGKTYLQTISDANIHNTSYPGNTQWGQDYTILHAEKDLAINDWQVDLVTHEVLENPSVAQMQANATSSGSGVDNWKMTYISLELKNMEILAGGEKRRLADLYNDKYFEKDKNGNPAPKAGKVPDAASGTQGPEYLLIIPFELTGYNSFYESDGPCLRLVRDATHFSIGAGEKGTEPYGAWERVTTRNPGHDLKILTRFTGDLNIFSGGKEDKEPQRAYLELHKGGGSNNKAELSVDGDPAVYPVKATENNESINGLWGGTGMKVKTRAQAGYSVSVTVYQGTDTSVSGIVLSHTVVTDQQEYTFVMPEGVDVTVVVRFSYENAEQFQIFLMETQKEQSQKEVNAYRATKTDPNYQPEEDPLYDPDDAGAQKTGNHTKVTTLLPDMFQTGDLPDPAYTDPPDSEVPSGASKPNETVTIEVTTHADYVAVVKVYDRAQNAYVNSLTATAGTGATVGVAGGTTATLSSGSSMTVTYTMRTTDMEVQVTYRPADKYKATLEVYHASGSGVTDMNEAQLAYLTYDDDNLPSTAYSGRVYENEAETTDLVARHRAVKGGTDKIGWVPKSAAALSGSLGGDDGAVGRDWIIPNDPVVGSSAIMSLAASSALTGASDLADRLTGQDLSTLVITSNLTGMRKNLYKELYGDTEIYSDTEIYGGSAASGEAQAHAFANVLWEIRTRILSDTATGGLKDTYVKSAYQEDGTTEAYKYLDLTPAQVQAYILEIQEAEDIYRANMKAYEAALLKYRLALQVYDSIKEGTGTSGVKAPVAPTEPAKTTVDSDGVRTYQGVDYRTATGGTGYLEQYDSYITDYQTYVDFAAEYGRVPDSSVTAGDPDYPTAKEPKAADFPAAVTVDILSDTPVAPATEGAATLKVDGYASSWKNNAASGDPFIMTRSSRKVSVVMAADSRYEVDKVELWHVDGAGVANNPFTAAEGVTTPSGDYVNVYTFNMPAEDCVVRVTYRLRGTRDLKWSVIGAAGLTSNLTRIVAYQSTDNAPATPRYAIVPHRVEESNAGHQIESPYGDTIPRVLVDSTVTVYVKCSTGYQATVTARDVGNGGASIAVTAVAAPNPADGKIYTFKIPAGTGTGNVELEVEYSPESIPMNTATIVGTTYPGDPPSMDNSANWQGGGTVRTSVPAGEVLIGEIDVAEGYYIHAVTATGASGTYPCVISGDGYNNGYGTWSTGASVPIKLWVTMPAEDLTVTVVFKKGPPPVPPGNALTLTVVDDDNDGETKADNWAKATILNPDKTDDFAIGPVGKGATGGGVLSKSDYADAGRVVRLDMSPVVTYIKETGKPDRVDPDNSYYISAVTVSPSKLGVAITWHSPTEAEFIVPAGSAGITVEFKKGLAPTYFLNAYRTENGSAKTALAAVSGRDNTIDTAASDTIESFMKTTRIYELRNQETHTSDDPTPVITYTILNPETVPNSEDSGGVGAAALGEEVTMTFTAKPGWYVAGVELVAGISSRHLSMKGAGSEVKIIKGRNDGAIKGLGEADPDYTTFEAKFNMPAGNTWFIVHYRQGPKPQVPEYAMTLILRDEDNVVDPETGSVIVDNYASATAVSVTGKYMPENAPTRSTATLGKLQPGYSHPMTGTVYTQQGDKVTVHFTVQKDFAVEYVIVTPAGLMIHPVYKNVSIDASGVTTGEAEFNMPASNVTVIVSLVKGEARKFTANLILRPPTGYTVRQAGKGTFLSPTTGTLDDYHTKAVYSLMAQPGTSIDIGLFANDGFYIRKITIDPYCGAEATLTGGFGAQNGAFYMPEADVNVNVWFEKKWPDEVYYDLTLKVIDPAYSEEHPDHNYAALYSVKSHETGAVTSLDPNNHRVYGLYGSDSYTVEYAAKDKDTVMVEIYKVTQPDLHFHLDTSSILVVDSNGDPVHWWYTTGTGGNLSIAFTMPPRSTTVSIIFLSGEPPVSEHYTLRLHTAGTNTATEADPAERDAVLVQPASVITGNPAQLTADGESTVTLAGTSIAVTATPGTDPAADPGDPRERRYISAAYAIVASTGEQIMLPVVHVTGGGTTTFAMPQDDADVYLVFRNGPAPDPDEYMRMNLIVSGPAGSGSAKMEENEDAANFIDVTAPGADVLFVEKEKKLTVTFSPNPGYYISGLTVTDGAGTPLAPGATPTDSALWYWNSLTEETSTDPSTWHHVAGDNNKSITVTVPVNGGTVHVTYAPIPAEDPDYVVQVVVNDEAYTGPAGTSRNDAGLYWDTRQKTDALGNPVWNDPPTNTDPAMENFLARLKKAKAGEWIDLHLTVHEGYKIEYIKVIPQEYGISPALYLTPMDSQSTGFFMPAGNVTVYVKFVTDGLPRYNATLVVAGAHDPDNKAQITSGYTGTRGPITPGQSPVSVRAAAGREWVTVDYWWAAGKNVQSVTVKDLAGKDVPFTQVDPNKITLPMVAKDIVITVTYKDDPDPEGYPVVLHVIDKDQIAPYITPDTMGYGRLVYDPTAPYNAPAAGAAQNTGNVFVQNNGAEGTYTISVPAGKIVDLTAFSNKAQGVYIESAFVLYQAGGQMIKMDLTPDVPGPGFSGLKDGQFAVHPGVNDVYVTLTRKTPTQDEFSAVLMLKGPATDTSSMASIYVGANHETAEAAGRFDSVTVNDPDKGFGYVTATRHDTITVSVYPAPGYAIDYILMTPLGEPTVPIRVDNTYTFSMPARNVAITVYLKESNERDYTATLHLIQYQKGSQKHDNRGVLSWTPNGLPTAKIEVSLPADKLEAEKSMVIKENSTVTLGAILDTTTDPGYNGYVVLAAFVLRDTVLVPLSPSLEGLRETVSTGADAGLPDGEATFTMPAGDVDVYLVVTDDPPANPNWHTAVLVVTDKKVDGSDTKLDVGRNYATIQGPAPDAFTPPESKVAKTGDVDSDPPKILSKKGVEFITVWEGDQVTTTVGPAQTGYSFNREATKSSLTHSVSGVSTVLDERSENPYVYVFNAGNCNSAVAVYFESANAIANPLTVIAEDADNPGNGTVDNIVKAKPADMTELTLHSTSSAGAYQVIPNVNEGKTVDITINARPGYQAVAFYRDANMVSDPGDKDFEPDTAIPLTRTGSAGAGYTYKGNITMPAVPATVTVIFYRAYTATLTIVDRNTTSPTSQAQMTEVFKLSDTITVDDKTAWVHELRRVDTIEGLPTGTELTAFMIELQSSGKLTAVTLTEHGSTTLMAPTAPQVDLAGGKKSDAYRHTINRTDPTITFIVDGADTDDLKHYLAAVNVVNAPAGTAPKDLVSIATDDATNSTGDIWTTAKVTMTPAPPTGDTVTTTVKVPEGYKAEVTAKLANGTVVNFLSYNGTNGLTKVDLPATATGSGTQTHTVTFEMPQSNVQVTVKYIKTQFDLTLRISDGTGKANTTLVTPDATQVVGTKTTLTADHDTTVVTVPDLPAKHTVTVKATPEDATVQVTNIFYKTGSGVVGKLTNILDTTDPGNPTPTDEWTFDMPQDDVTVWVIYGKAGALDPDDKWYIASVSTVNTGDLPGNRAVSITDMTTTGLPADSPDWAAALEKDQVKVSFTVEPGWYATVTAKRTDTGASVPVIQQGSTGSGTAAVFMPAADVIITITYTEGDKPSDTLDMTLRLVGHDEAGGNKGTLTGSSLATPFTLKGSDATGAVNKPVATAVATAWLENKEDAKSPVRMYQSSADTGDRLLITADWDTGYRIQRVTVSTPIDPGDLTLGMVETEIPVNTYGSNVAANLFVPGPNAIVTVYYTNIYTATLHIVNPDLADETDPPIKVKMTDDRTPTVTNQGTDTYVDDEGEKLIELLGGEQQTDGSILGGEQIQTTAKPKDSGDPTKPIELIEVVYESDVTGAWTTPATLSGVADRYDFQMPKADTDVYVYFEQITPEKPRPYVAKVAIDPASVGYGIGDNRVRIKNETDEDAPFGKYWTGARDGDTITITVELEPGYQAEIISAKRDANPVAGTNFDYYVSRTRFVVSGKEATFTMPGNTDATVTIRYIKGYKLTLEMTDLTTEGQFVSEVTATETASSTVYGKLHAESEVGGVVKANVGAVRWPGGGNYTATLKVASTGTKVMLQVDQDPTYFVNVEQGKISGLDKGQKVTLVPASDVFITEVTVQNSSTTVLPAACTDNGDGTVTVTMPETDVLITVITAGSAPTGGIILHAAVPAGHTSRSVLQGLPKDLDVGTELGRVTTGDANPGATANIRVTRATPFTGTILLSKGTNETAANVSAATPAYKMPAEDTLEIVLYENETTTDDLLAKVQLRGESDVFGHNDTVSILDKTEHSKTDDPATTTVDESVPDTVEGTIWTTTMMAHTIDVSLRVTKGYVAKIKVLRDDSMYEADGVTLKPESDWVFLDVTDYTFLVNGLVSPATDANNTEVTLGYKQGTATTLPYSQFNSNVSDVQHFTFVMPEDRTAATNGATDPGDKKTDVTVIITYEFAGTLPAPYDPYHVVAVTDATAADYYLKYQGTGKPADTVAKLTDGFIYADNRMDYALVEIPTLIQDGTLYDTDVYGTKPVTFYFYIYDAAADKYLPLEPGKDVELVPYDEDNLKAAGDPYNYETLYSGYSTKAAYDADTAKDSPTDFVGSRFELWPLEPAPGETASAALTAFKKMLDNDGSIDATDKKPRLFVTAESAQGKSTYTEVYMRVSYSVAVRVISYGPAHPLVSVLYPLKTQAEIDKEHEVSEGVYESGYSAGDEARDKANFAHYVTDAHRIIPDLVKPVEGETGKWMQLVKVSSADLFGGYMHEVTAGDKATYALTIEKASNLKYTRVDLELEVLPDSAGDPACEAAFYNPATKTFTIQDIVTLIAGDVDSNGATKWQDYTFIQRYVQNPDLWSREAKEPVKPDTGADAATVTAYNKAKAAWDISVYNPATWAYRCDLNSDGMVSDQDLFVLTTQGNYGRTAADYLWAGSVLPHGFAGPGYTGPATLFSFWGDACEAPFDPIMDAQVTPPELLEQERREHGAIWDGGNAGEKLELPGEVEGDGIGGPNLSERPVVEASDAALPPEPFFVPDEKEKKQ